MSTHQEPLENIQEKEEELLKQGLRIRALHEIISCPDLSFDEQIDETLRLGCKLLGTEIGKVSRQDPENNVSEFLNTIVLSDLPARRGVVLPLDKTFCQVTFSSAEAIAISHVAESEYGEHPAASFLGMQSYIGCTIKVHGTKFGTVNFSNRTPVVNPFTEADKDLVNLIGSWISVMMERQLEAEELRKSKERAEAANQAKSSFVANMSHEIRTPLTSIIGFAESALDDDQTPAERQSALRNIRSSGDHLLNLINGILDFSKIEAGELDIENVDVNPLQVIAEMESIVIGQARKKQLDFGIEYVYPLPRKIKGDPLRLKQVLLNLCGNALKFTDNGSVCVQVEYDANEHVLNYRVTDTGIGMTQEQLEYIFKPFKQADTSVTRRFGGTGLGLCLSKKLVELMGGTLQARSDKGKGSTFIITFPLEQTTSEAANLIHSQDDIAGFNVDGQPVAVMEKLSGKVLLAEDNDMNQELFKRYLEKMGLKVTIAENGAVAVNLAQQYSYDLIYMDMQMPMLSGLDAVKMLREGGYTGAIVMLTANVTLEDRNLCKQMGSDDFITTPIDRQKLYKITKQYLKH